MLGRLAVVAVTAGAAAGLGGGVAAANPAPGGQSVLCHYTLSAPHVVDVSGTPMVTATVAPADCTGTATPKSTQVCIATTDSVGRCTDIRGFNTAQVYFAPYKPGVNYVASGRGCAVLSAPPVAICTTVGPSSATL